MIDYAELRRGLERAVKSVPPLCAEGEWRQDGWVLSLDGQLTQIDAPLVSAGLYSAWTKIAQHRVNGWVGQSFYVHTYFDGEKTLEQVVAQLASQFSDKVRSARSTADDYEPKRPQR